MAKRKKRNRQDKESKAILKIAIISGLVKLTTEIIALIKELLKH